MKNKAAAAVKVTQMVLRSEGLLRRESEEKAVMEDDLNDGDGAGSRILKLREEICFGNWGKWSMGR